jgi:hypothetical protein
MENKLPTLAELHHDIDTAFKNDSLNLLLNQEPPKTFIKPHPFAKNNGQPIMYIPVGKVEFLLTRIFQNWRLEVISYAQLFNSVAVHARLHYTSPLDGKWYSQDGLGAVGVQTDKGAQASDLNAIKQDAIMKALPAAESYALKDAAEKLGKLFGADLNRADSFDFKGAYTPKDNSKERARVIEWLKSGNVTFGQLVEFKEGEIFIKYANDTEITELVIKLENEL